MALPSYKLVISRKDGKDQTFKDYRGEEVTKKFRHAGAVWTSKKGDGFNVTLDAPLKLDSETYWISLYPVEDRGSRDNESSHESAKPRAGSARRRPAPKTDDEDLFGEDE